jgi:hypothetical protein
MTLDGTMVKEAAKVAAEAINFLRLINSTFDMEQFWE